MDEIYYLCYYRKSEWKGCNMIVIVCVDDNKGMMFNHRRQSQDKKLREHILNMVSPSILWMNSYSKRQFLEDNRVVVDEAFLEKAAKNEYCFIENIDVTPYADKVEKIILFQWNRKYPADTFFPMNLSEWTFVESEDFAGDSHDKITKEIYCK